jgi:hypothetical protein
MRPDGLPPRVAVVVLSACALMAYALTACSVDPTEGAVAVTIDNDQPAAVVIKQCRETCTATHESHELQPGGSVVVNGCVCVAAQYWIATDVSGRTLGCLNLKMESRQEGVHVRLSSLAPCSTGTGV